MRRFLLALFALTLLGSGSGCGGADGSLLATAVRNTEDAGGAEVAFQMEIELPGQAQPIVMTGNGVEDAKNRRASLTFQGPPPVGHMDLVQDGMTMYMRSDAFSTLGGGKEWMKMDLEKIGSSMGLDMSELPTVQTASDQLRMLEVASDGITEHGTETVRGEQTTHYSATVDVERMPNGERIAELSGLEEMPVDVWIDGEDRIRRMEIKQDMNAAGVQMSMHVAVEYIRFGVAVDIGVPDDDEVFDVGNLVGSAS
jgi:hypothetical protein